MKLFFLKLLLHFVFILLFTSCVPVAGINKAQDFPPLPEYFLANSSKFLVIPVWQDMPIFAHETPEKKKINTYLGDQIILDRSNINQLHNYLPGSLAFGFIHSAGAIGKNSYIEGVYIISEDGQIIWKEQKSDGWRTFPKHCFIGPKWREKLIQTFTDGKIVFSEAEKKLLSYEAERVLLWFPFHPYDWKFSYPTDKKNELIEFIEKIPEANNDGRKIELW